MPISDRLRIDIQGHLEFLYGRERAGAVWPALEAKLEQFSERNRHLADAGAVSALTERDAILITYGDQVREPGVPPLQSLREVLSGALNRVVSGVHILPFFPYSSDDGFSVIDYIQVDAALGDWADVEGLGESYRLMFDVVVNHTSQHSEWFQRFLAGDREFRDWYITVDPDDSQAWVPQVTRPRALPLLTPVRTAQGDTLVWTTFSVDQIDLNFAHPPVLLKMLEILLLYVEKGAQFIRLDAIAYLWKRIGTSCIHLEETHRVVKLMRSVLDAVAPGVILITETNVPHEENISYFGHATGTMAGTDEAQMVYQFPLAPLVLHSILAGEAKILSTWAAGLEPPAPLPTTAGPEPPAPQPTSAGPEPPAPQPTSAGPEPPAPQPTSAGPEPLAPQATFFNFTASHDGVGVMPARGLLSDAQVQRLVDAVLAHGGRVSYKTNPDGSRSVYELNISYFDALSDPAADEPLPLQLARFMVSQAIMLALSGVPGIYVHSLLGSRSWQEGVALTGHNRAINRQKFDRETLEQELADPDSLRHRVLSAYSRLLRARGSDPALHPHGRQEVLDLNDQVFVLRRTSPDGKSQVLCLHNVSAQVQTIALPGDRPGALWHDLVSDQIHVQEGTAAGHSLPPYGVRWFKRVP